MPNRVSGIAVLILLLTSMFAFTIQIQSAKSLENEWWDSSWRYRRQVNITENSGYPLVNFPVEVSFEHDGHMHADGRDVRIIQDLNEISFCITGISSSWATVMFEINLNASSTESIYIYYGNPNATAPSYSLVPLTISEGQKSGNATVDDRLFIGWDYVAWGVQPGWFIIGGNMIYVDNNQVVLWNDFRVDFNHNGVLEKDEDLLTDFDMWKGGIGRSHVDLGNFVERSYGLGDFQQYVQTPIFVDLVFADVRLRIFRGHNFVETTQADRLQMEATSWDFAKYRDGTEENIIDGIGTNPELWNIMCDSSINPGWMAYRNSMTGYMIGGIGFNTSSNYLFRFAAKESHAWDRQIFFEYTSNQTQDPYDQPAECRIYWYADGSNSYEGISKTSAILTNLPSTSFISEETVPEFSPSFALPLFMIAALVSVVIFRIHTRHRKKVS